MSNSNPLIQPLWLLFDQLNIAFGLLFHLEIQLRGYMSIMEGKLQQKQRVRPGMPTIGAGASLVISDLTERPPNGWRNTFKSGGFATVNEEYIKTAEDLISRNSAWVMAQGWERFESYLLDIAATYLNANPSDADPTRLQKWISKNKIPNTFLEWRQFVKRTHKGTDNEDLLDWLRALAPHIVVAEDDNDRNLSLVSWYKVVARVRHAVTHSDLVISSNELIKLAPHDIKLLEAGFPGVSTTEGYRLTLTSKNAREGLETFGEYGFSIFKSISMKSGYDWDILSPGRKPMVKGIL